MTSGAFRGDGSVIVWRGTPTPLLKQRLDTLQSVLLKAWGRDTCAPEDQADWTPTNPSRGQCITTVLVVHDELGGDLVRGEVHVEGKLVDYHWWNRLPNGLEVDFTRQQFAVREIVSGSTFINRPADGGRVAPQYDRLRLRVDAMLKREG